MSGIRTVEHLHPNDDLLRKLHNFCPGCGNGIILHTLIRSLKTFVGSKCLKKTEPLKDFAFVSGIGCSGWIVSPHLNADTVHTTHGRPIPVATGIKVGNPKLNVVVISGDGDLASIGGNHLIHAARRNVEMLCILVNNFIFGMTGGQCGVTTLHNATTTTTPYGNLEYPLNVTELVATAGASYAARWTTYHINQLEKSINKGFEHSMNGFAFIEVLSPCPTQFEKRMLGTDNPKILFDYLKDNSVLLKNIDKHNRNELVDKFILGEFADKKVNGYVKNLDLLKQRLCR